MKALLALIVLIVLVAGVPWVFSESLPFGSEVTIYQVFCKDIVRQGVCASKEEIARSVTYKVFPEQQTVVYWYGTNDPPKRYRNCAIRDKFNWSCQLGVTPKDEPDATMDMVDGERREQWMHSLPSLFYAVPKWRWW